MIDSTTQKNPGLTRQALRTWGALLMVMGIAGKCILQNNLLDLDTITTSQLLAAMDADPSVMIYASLALVLQIAEACAVPLFAFMLVEGFQKTSDLTKYGIRVLGVAVLSEIPYNLAMGGQLLVTGSRNPVFGMVLCLVVLHFLKSYAGKSLKNVAIKVAVFLAAMLWTKMLEIDHGFCLLVLCAVLWLMRSKPAMQTYMGCMAAICCCVFSTCYMAAPMSFLFIHKYNGEQGRSSRAVNYLWYPAALLVFGLVSVFL